MLWLRQGPEDLAASSRLLQQMILFNLITGTAVLLMRFNIGISVLSSLVDLMVTLGFTYFLLMFMNRQPRFVQTASALCGIGAVFHLLFWPFLMVDGSVDANGQKMLWVMMLFLTSWELLVMAHIIRRAIESGVASSIILSFGLFFISVIVSQLLF